jgi:hypothetical protein
MSSPDPYKAMTIAYNHLNLPRLFTWTGGSFNGNSMEVLYDPAAKETKGVAPPGNRTEIDHINKKRDGGSGTPNNGRIRCRDCNNNDDRPKKQ